MKETEVNLVEEMDELAAEVWKVADELRERRDAQEVDDLVRTLPRDHNTLSYEEEYDKLIDRDFTEDEASDLLRQAYGVMIDEL